MQVKKQQLEPDMEQQTGSKIGQGHIKAAYLTYMQSESEVAHLCPTLCDPMECQSTACEMPGWMKHKLESRLPGEISITLDMQMIPP